MWISERSKQPNLFGYLKLIKDVSHEKLQTKKNIELEKIYVLKEYLDKKVGKGLILEAINFSKQHHFETLFLGVWQEHPERRRVRFTGNSLQGGRSQLMDRRELACCHD